MPKKVSLKDIARELDVSVAAVSYVLSGKGDENRIGTELAKKIRQLASELNYKPNFVARGLRKGTSYTLGLIVADISNPFFSEMAKVVEDEAAKYGYSVIFGSSDEDVEKSSMIIETMLNRQVDGLIISAAEDTDEQIRQLVENKTPVVLIDRKIQDLPVSTIMIDNYNATYNACNCLVERGYKKIGYMSYKSNMAHIKQRLQGFKQAMKDAGLQGDKMVYEVRYKQTKQDVNKGMAKFTKGAAKKEALIFATNTLTTEALYYIVKNKVIIPDDVAVIGFDGSIAFDLFYCPLTYVKQPIEEMARQSVRILIEQITGASYQANLELSSKLIKRASCG